MIGAIDCPRCFKQPVLWDGRAPVPAMFAGRENTTPGLFVLICQPMVCDGPVAHGNTISEVVKNWNDAVANIKKL